MTSAEFQRFYSLLPEPMLLVSPEGQILATNPAFEQLVGRADRAGGNLRDLVSDEDGKLSRYLLQWQRTSELLPGAIILRRSDARDEPLRAEGALLPGSPAQVLLRLLPRGTTTSRFVALNERIEALNREIAERRRAEASLRRANADLEQFAFSASHDLREPLRMVSLYADLLRRRCLDQLDGQARQYLWFAVEGARRMEALVTDLLAYTQAMRANEEPPTVLVPADEALDHALANLSAAIQESGASIGREPLPHLLVHSVHLVQLFQNLVSNAIKYRGQGPPSIHVGVRSGEGALTFFVRDNGIGIDPQYTDRIFGMFKRLHNANRYSGTGVGLAICQKIVEGYGGRIWVESAGEGHGSTFLFTVPEAELVAARPARREL